MKQIVVDSKRFFEACGSPESASSAVLLASATSARLCYASESWTKSARMRSGARYLGWFYSAYHQRDVLVLNADGTLIIE